jgi:antitoxin component YwqK of YwqJK toxin-antitoxin module
MNENNLLENNLEIFGRFCPDLVEEIKNASCDLYEFCNSSNGSLNLKKKDKSQDFHFHSKENPEFESQLWFESLQSIKEVEGLIVFGIGLGYFFYACKEWLDENEERYLVFLEHDFSALKMLFSTQAGSDIMSHPRVIVLGLKSEKEQPTSILQKSLHLVSLLLFGNSILFSELNSYALLKNQLWKSAKKIIQYQIKEKRFTTQILKPSYLKNKLSNTAANYWNFQKAKLFYGLEGSFKGIPAIICGAGPSIINELPILQNIKDTALVIGAGTGLNVLNNNGIFSYLGVGIDPSEPSRSRIFTNFSYMMPFCYQLGFNKDAMEILHGPKIFFKGPDFFGIDKWLENQVGLEEYPIIPIAVSTTVACVNIAHALGCNPIVLVGIDLAYTDKMRYPNGVSVHPTDSKREKDKLSQVHESEIIHARGIGGENVFSRMDWIREGKEYVDFALKNPEVEIINATSRGLDLQEIRSQSLKEIADEYLRSNLDLDNLIHAQIQNCQNIEPDETKLKKILDQWIESSDRCNQLLLELLDELKTTSNKFSVDLNFDQSHVTEKFIELHKKIQKEDSFRYLLRYLAGDYEETFFRTLFPLIYRHELFTDRERNFKKLQYAVERCTFMFRCISMLKDYILQSIAKHDRENVCKNHIPMDSEMSQSLSDKGLYSFEHGQYQIHDDEIDFHWEEEFSPSMSLGKDSKQEKGEFQFAEISEGQFLMFYPDGELKGECFYKNGKLHGPSIFYSKDGIVLAKGWYVENIKQGKNLQYYLSGRICNTKRFKDGELEGLQEYFYDTGMQQAALHYKKGNLDGRVALYNEDGSLRREVHFFDGKLHGIERMWDKKGQLLFESEYSQGQPIGISRSWYSNGQIKNEKRFYDIPEHYDLTAWSEEGVITEKVLYVPQELNKEIVERSEGISNDIKNLKTQLRRLKNEINKE